MLYNEKLNYQDCFRLIKSKFDKNSFKVSEMSVDSFTPKGKTIIVLCGNKTKDARKASLYNKYCHAWIRDPKMQKEVAVCSVFYPGIQPLLSSMEPNPAFDYMGLSDAIFDKVIYKNNMRLSADEIAQNLNNITFLGHSIGGHVMNELMHSLEIKLKNSKFTKAEIEKICSSIVFIAYSPFTLVDAKTNNIYIAPIYDSLGSAKLVYKKLLNYRNSILSNPNINVSSIKKSTTTINHSDFINVYKSATAKKDLLTFISKNNIAITPDLLYNDGMTEDHNMAGVINYSKPDPYKTKAGVITTNLISNLLEYSLSHERDSDFMNNLFIKINNEIRNYNKSNYRPKEQ